MELVGHGVNKAETYNTKAFCRKKPAFSCRYRRTEAQRRINAEMGKLSHNKRSLAPQLLLHLWRLAVVITVEYLYGDFGKKTAGIRGLFRVLSRKTEYSDHYRYGKYKKKNLYFAELREFPCHFSYPFKSCCTILLYNFCGVL